MFLDSIAVVILILVIVFPFLLAWYISSILRKNRDLDRVRQDRVTTRIEKLARQTTEAIDSIRNSQIALNANLDNAAKIISHHSRFIDSQIKKLNELTESDILAARRDELIRTKEAKRALERLMTITTMSRQNPETVDILAIESATNRIEELEAILSEGGVNARKI